MTTYRQIIYMVLDELKGISDDFYYTENHIMYLIDKYRAFLLKLKYSDIKRKVPKSNYQTFTFTLSPLQIDTSNNAKDVDSPDIPVLPEPPNIYSEYFKSTEIPLPMNISHSNILFKEYEKNYNISIIPYERLKFTGHNKYLKSIKYCSFYNDGNGNCLFLKNSILDPLLYKDYTVQLSAVFESPTLIYQKSLNTENIIDQIVPLEESLISPLLEMIVKDLTSALFKPEDRNNNSKDDIGNLSHFISRNVKSDLAKLIYG